MKVEQFYNKNQFLIRDDKTYTYILQSYDSIVAKIDKNGVLTFGRDWNYSHTTLKHLYLFLDDYMYAITDAEQFEVIRDLRNATNKKAYLQKAINKKIIKVNNNL